MPMGWSDEQVMQAAKDEANMLAFLFEPAQGIDEVTDEDWPTLLAHVEGHFRLWAPLGLPPLPEGWQDKLLEYRASQRVRMAAVFARAIAEGRLPRDDEPAGSAT